MVVFDGLVGTEPCMAIAERRNAVRCSVSRPAKLRCIRSGRYMTGQTRDVSSNGALLEVDRPPSSLTIGQRLEMGIAWNHRQVIVRSDHMTLATVVWSLGIGSTLRVAVKFDQPLATFAMSA